VAVTPLIRCSDLPLLYSDAGRRRLWAKHQPDYVPEPPSLAMQMGHALEDLGRQAFTAATGIDLYRTEMVLEREDLGIKTSGIDGMGIRDGERFFYEGKALHGRDPIEIAAQHYMPQIVGYSLITGTRLCAFGVISKKDSAFDYLWITVSMEQQRDLLRRVADFRSWLAVGEEPLDFASPAPPEPLVSLDALGVKRTDDPALTDALSAWVRLKDQVAQFEELRGILTSALPKDASTLLLPNGSLVRTKRGVAIHALDEEPQRVRRLRDG
jgi:hypothetical protein